MENEKRPYGLGQAIAKTVAHRDAVQEARRLAEASMTGLAASGVIENVPVLRWLAAGQRGLAAARDRLLLEKIARFLEPVAEVDENLRQKWATDLNEDPSERERVGAQLMLLLDRQDDIRKARIVGVLWRARLRGEITQATLELLSLALDRVFLPHLRVLSGLQSSIDTEEMKSRDLRENWDAHTGFDPIAIQDLRNAGLVFMPNEGAIKKQGDPRYAPSELGISMLTAVPLDELPA